MNRCVVGCPNASGLAKSLKDDLVNLRQNAPFDLDIVTKSAADHFTPGSVKVVQKGYVCKDCLFNAMERTDFKKHFNMGKSLDVEKVTWIIPTHPKS